MLQRDLPADSPPRRRLLGTALTVGLALAGCGRGEVVTLGESASPATSFRFGPPRLVAELASPERNDNPTLTADLLEIYFTSTREGGNSDIWYAQRASPSEPFSPPQRLVAVNSPFLEASGAVAADGQTFWLGSDRPGSAGFSDIWVSTRPSRTVGWSAPTLISLLSSPAADVPRPPGLHGLVMPVGSERGFPPLYRTYFSTRVSLDAPFGAPEPIPELVFPNTTIMDAFLTEDGLTLLYASSVGMAMGVGMGPADFYLARRPSTADPFAVVGALIDLNSPATERDPWLSPDGTRIFFASDRSGTLSIYQADVITSGP
jgi:hypothetical protein